MTYLLSWRFSSRRVAPNSGGKGLGPSERIPLLERFNACNFPSAVRRGNLVSPLPIHDYMMCEYQNGSAFSLKDKIHWPGKKAEICGLMRSNARCLKRLGREYAEIRWRMSLKVQFSLTPIIAKHDQRCGPTVDMIAVALHRDVNEEDKSTAQRSTAPAQFA